MNLTSSLINVRTSQFYYASEVRNSMQIQVEFLTQKRLRLPNGVCPKPDHLFPQKLLRPRQAGTEVSDLVTYVLV